MDSQSTVSKPMKICQELMAKVCPKTLECRQNQCNCTWVWSRKKLPQTMTTSQMWCCEEPQKMTSQLFSQIASIPRLGDRNSRGIGVEVKEKLGLLLWKRQEFQRLHSSLFSVRRFKHSELGSFTCQLVLIKWLKDKISNRKWRNGNKNFHESKRVDCKRSKWVWMIRWSPSFSKRWPVGEKLANKNSTSKWRNIRRLLTSRTRRFWSRKNCSFRKPQARITNLRWNRVNLNLCSNQSKILPQMLISLLMCNKQPLCLCKIPAREFQKLIQPISPKIENLSARTSQSKKVNNLRLHLKVLCWKTRTINHQFLTQNGAWVVRVL